MFQVKARAIVGVDPKPQFDLRELSGHMTFFPMTSDKFFSEEAKGLAFDLVFLDGLHEWRQTLRDLQNALRVLSPGGLIVIDDVAPTDEFSADPDPSVVEKAREAGVVDHGRWYGDVFKILHVLELLSDSLGYVTVGGASGLHGQTVVWRKYDQANATDISASELRRIDELSYEPRSPGATLPKYYHPVKESRRTYARIVRNARNGSEKL